MLAAIAAFALTGLAAAPGGREQPAKLWSLQAPRALPVPKVQKTSWPRTDIDRFVLARLEETNPDTLTPKEALELLYELRKQLEN